MQRQGKEVSVTDEALNFLTRRDSHESMEARFLKRHIDE